MSEDVRIIHGNCLEVLPTLAAGSVDCVITDPPYGTEVDRDGYGRRQNYGGIGRFIAGDSDLAALDEMLVGVGRLLAPDAWLAIFCSPKRHAETAALIESHGFPIAGEVIWDKASPGLGGGIRYQHETILLCKHGAPAGRGPLFSVLRSYVSRERKHLRHPHEKPVDVMRNLVTYCSRRNEVVLDPFAGSGTTGVAALKTGRGAILIEREAAYVEIIHRRIDEAATPLFDALPSEALS